MSRYVFHYHASRQIEPGVTAELDGLLVRPAFIQSLDDYRNVKEVIAGDAGVPVDGLVLRSLSFLGFEITAPTVSARQE